MHRRINENLYSIISRYGNVLSSAQEKFLLILFILILTLFPLMAFSLDCDVGGDIPFSVKNDTGNDLQVDVAGPAFRISGCLVIPAHSECPRFYAADYGVFTPIGEWSARTGFAGGFFCNVDRNNVKKRFCLKSNPFLGDAPVNIVLSVKFGSLTLDVSGDNVFIPSDQDNPNCPKTAVSYLGDKPRQSGRDRDGFLFDGTEGEEITITLEANPKSGNNGGIASLGLRGGSLDEFVEGELPQEIIATLPSDGKYSIIVGQPKDIPRSKRYEGDYFLTVESPTSNVAPLELGNNVER